MESKSLKNEKVWICSQNSWNIPIKSSFLVNCRLLAYNFTKNELVNKYFFKNFAWKFYLPTFTRAIFKSIFFSRTRSFNDMEYVLPYNFLNPLLCSVVCYIETSQLICNKMKWSFNHFDTTITKLLKVMINIEKYGI